MAPVVRVDDEVWAWLKGHAQPFEDTPNSVLRRFAGLDKRTPKEAPRSPNMQGTKTLASETPSKRRASKELLRSFVAILEEKSGASVQAWSGGHRRR